MMLFPRKLYSQFLHNHLFWKKEKEQMNAQELRGDQLENNGLNSN
jgi:hypothetical protein